ncbi:MAG: hypothetical protein B7X55_02220 [Rhodobacterales bacterium 34-62-10]|nr:MAG: hypothetical protein B7X55_02220 [Rhodobacterales bacterium 34-62-10]
MAQTTIINPHRYETSLRVKARCLCPWRRGAIIQAVVLDQEKEKSEQGPDGLSIRALALI